jgi:serralysin
MPASTDQHTGSSGSGNLQPQPVLPTIGSSPTGAGPTGDAAVDSIISGVRWQTGAESGHVIQYSFASQQSSWLGSYGNDEPGFWAGDFSSAEKAVIRKALGAWSAVADIQFVEVNETDSAAGDIRFGRSTLPSTAWAYLPDASAEGGDVWLGQQRFPSVQDPEVVDWIYAQGSWRYFTLMHEIGHALGLLHTHDGSDGVGAALDPAVDWIGASIMSYRSYPGQELGQGYGVEIYPSTPMGLDVAAIQSLYGASDAFSGNTTWHWDDGPRIYQAIWDSGGIDTIDWSNQTTSATIRLAENGWSDLGEPFRWSADGGGSLPGTVFIARGVLIENAVGGHAGDRIEGNQLANRIEGRDGDDVLLGGDASDALFGGVGNDRIEGGEGNDLASGQFGADLIQGGNGDDALYGFGDGDRLYGQGGNDMLSGGDEGDRLYGDTGDDLLDGASGTDWLFGGTGDNQLNGGAGDDNLYGGGGSDRLQGSGTDTLEVHFQSAGFRIEGTSAIGRLVDVGAGDGNLGLDRFTSIERVVFLDRTLVWQGGQWDSLG